MIFDTFVNNVIRIPRINYNIQLKANKCNSQIYLKGLLIDVLLINLLRFGEVLQNFPISGHRKSASEFNGVGL